MNCIQQYEIDLRGHKISVIENLGSTQNQFDSIDMSDNAVVTLEGFPKLQRLRTLLLNNNRIAKIARNLEQTIPSLEMLILSGNKISTVRDLEPLCTLPKLRYLSLTDCPVAKERDYRLHVISLCPHLKMLDFRKVSQKERAAAAKRFPDAAVTANSNGQAAASTAEGEPPANEGEPAAKRARVAADGEGAGEGEEEPPTASGKGPSPEQLTAIKAAIANAQTLEDVQRLEAALKTGHVPSEISIGADAMEEG